MHAAARPALLGGAACLYVLLHALTLTRCPVPYFDDTFFASVGASFLRTGALQLAVSPLWMADPVYLYGPVYFLLQRVVFEHLGFGIFQNRMLGLTFGVGIVLLVFVALRQAGVRRNVALSACILLALDPTLHLSLHSGRMDNVALFFVLAAFVLLQRAWAADGTASLRLCAIAGLLTGLGVLTTPRSSFLVVCMGGILLVRSLLVRTASRALQLACWALPLVGLYLSWVGYAFGGVQALVTYYGRYVDTYVGGRFFVRAVHAPLLAVLVAVAAFRLATISGKRAMRFDELLAFTLAGVVAFHALGINPSRFGTVYSIYFVPLVYMALACLTAGIAGDRIRRGVFALLLVVNAGVFAARTVLELGQWRSRDPAPVERMVRAAIPQGSRVIGDDKFYFAVVTAGSDYQYWQRGGTVSERVAYHADQYGFDYLVTNEDEHSPLFRAYATRVPLLRVASLGRDEPGAVAAWLSRVARLANVGSPLVGDYASTVFVRADRAAGRR
jgi:hypothetical protein